MSLKTSTFTMARSAIFKHTVAFSTDWGEMEQTEEGAVSFSSPPTGLESLTVEPEFNKRWMGGTCAMNFTFSHEVISNDIAKLTFKGNRGGEFIGKANGEFSSNLLSALNADTKLKQTLLTIDLDKLEVNIQDARVETVLTPYGGGLAYLIIPPMRTIIPLPPEQITPLAWSLERLATIIESIKE